MTNRLVTGYPGAGKTTAIIKRIKQLNEPISGFYTREIRNIEGGREGFKIVGIKTKKEGILASTNN